MAESRVSCEGGEPLLSLVNRELVVPAKPTDRHHYFLSCFDIFWKDNHYNQRLIFYENASDLFREGVCGQEVMSGQEGGAVNDIGRAVMEKLKSSLALCLVHYYPWCGRIGHGKPDHRTVIDCNDAGVEFVEAFVDLPISLLSQQGFQVKPFFEKLCQHVDHSGDCLYSSPLLSIQATLFSDGGLALGISQSHVVADGQSLWNFMVSWGQCARGTPLSFPPVLNRELLAVPDPSPEKATWKGFTITEEDDIEEEEEKHTVMPKDENSVGTHSPFQEGKAISEASSSVGILSLLEKDQAAVGIEASGDSVGAEPSAKEDKVSNVGTKASLAEAPKLVQCVFNLPSSAVKNLKVEDGGLHTSYEVTCAHLWRHVTAARQRPSHEHTFMVVLANGRSRMKPPLPPAYFGNAIAFLINVTTVGKICSETLCATTSRIHNTVVELVEDSFVSFMHWVETHDNKVLSVILPQIPKGKGINAASSPRFPVYEVDFGWGKPEAVRAPKVQGDGEMVFFGGHPKSSPGDMEICMALPEDVLRRLLEDPTFLAKPPSSPFAN